MVVGVKDAESSAEQSFRFAPMVMIFGKDRGIDINKAIKMASSMTWPRRV